MIATPSVHCAKCSAYVGFADRCSSCGEPQRRPFLTDLHDRRGVGVFVAAIVILILLVVLGR